MLFTEFLILNENTDDYKIWKKNNVTLRGIKEGNNDNQIYGSFGSGLYTVPLSNKKLIKQYGELRFVVNAIPKNPKIVNSLNDAEIWRQTIIKKFCDKHNESYNIGFFENKTSFEKEMLNMGYDGFIIKGREIVNYKPKDILYFKTEDQLIRYYDQMIKNS